MCFSNLAATLAIAVSYDYSYLPQNACKTKAADKRLVNKNACLLMLRIPHACFTYAETAFTLYAKYAATACITHLRKPHVLYTFETQCGCRTVLLYFYCMHRLTKNALRIRNASIY